MGFGGFGWDWVGLGGIYLYCICRFLEVNRRVEFKLIILFLDFLVFVFEDVYFLGWG